MSFNIYNDPEFPLTHTHIHTHTHAHTHTHTHTLALSEWGGKQLHPGDSKVKTTSLSTANKTTQRYADQTYRT